VQSGPALDGDAVATGCRRSDLGPAKPLKVIEPGWLMRVAEAGDRGPLDRSQTQRTVKAALRLWLVSVGDSPLSLFRNGKLSQLNEDHSMAPKIDFMVKSGLMDPQVAATLAAPAS
jgi:serine/threonine protein phosphatase PrpC